jgi:ParB-like chromosome segregation protein Spo0J
MTAKNPTVKNHLSTACKLVPIEDLVANPRNPNTHTEDQLNRLAAILKSQGFRAPILVSNQSGFIVSGHGRAAAAKIAGMKKVPVSYQDFENEAQEWTHLIADNRIAELSELDNPKLKDLLEELDTGDTDLDLTGYSEREIGSLMSQVYQGDDLGLDPTDKLDVFRNTGVRQIVLVFPADEFDGVMAMIEGIRVKGGHETNTEAIEAAIEALHKSL